jgi:hypothetical protein
MPPTDEPREFVRRALIAALSAIQSGEPAPAGATVVVQGAQIVWVRF